MTENLPDVHNGDWVRLRKDAPANIAGGAGILIVEENRPGWARLYHTERDEKPSVQTYSEVPAPGEMLAGYVAEIWRKQDGPWIRFYLAEAHEHETQYPYGMPRRAFVEHWTPAEKAIRDAMTSVEVAGAHPLLTDAVVLLQQAFEKVADYTDRETL